MKQNSIMRDEVKVVGEDIAVKGQCLSEEDEFKTSEMARYGCFDHGGDVLATLHPEISLQRQHPNPWSTICWERFLPVRSLKVLLVESDDSTRQVVCALLRNCSYEVMAAANGLQALTVLEDMSIHVDLVLTEVVMPELSGIGLLNKIMSHKTCMNIPVIMMSSNGSMKTVFKCLSIGAVDFLVKPIRKNELKNLWQHVWRRCHSSSGSVSESGIQTRAPTKTKSVDDLDSNTQNSNEDESGSFGLKVGNASDNGSGTQSSWTKCAVENESPRSLSPSKKLVDHYDSTCALVIHSKSENTCNQRVLLTTNKECQETDDLFLGKGVEIGRSNTNSQNISYQTEKNHVNNTEFSGDKVNLSENDENNELRVDGMDYGGSNASGEPTNKEADLICGIDKNTDAQFVKYSASPTTITKILDCGYKHIEDVKELPSIELSLKRLRSSEENATLTNDDSNVLKRSGQSAFSRYNISAASNQVPTDYRGSCQASLAKSSEAVNMEATCNMISNSDASPLNKGSSGSNKNDEIAINAFSKPVDYKDETLTASAGQPVVIEGHQVQVQVHHHHHHYHHHVHDKQQNQHKMPDDDDSSFKNMAAPAPQCGSSNMFPVPMEGIAANCSINGNVSGSNHGSNAHIGSSAAVNIGGSNGESDNGITGKCDTGFGTGNDNGGRLASNRFALREAALKKFRQKRKERNFGKKVRYHSRKRLAEQRPRVRGQFVRLMMNHISSPQTGI